MREDPLTAASHGDGVCSGRAAKDAIGKRTTATILTRALDDRGVKAVMVGTGQTGLIQGARYGIALDAIPSQFCPSEMEAAIVEAFEGEVPDAIIIEGQGALSHPAYLTSTFILRGGRPDGVVLQHAPGRTDLGDFGQMAMPAPAMTEAKTGAAITPVPEAFPENEAKLFAGTR